MHSSLLRIKVPIKAWPRNSRQPPHPPPIHCCTWPTDSCHVSSWHKWTRNPVVLLKTACCSGWENHPIHMVNQVDQFPDIHHGYSILNQTYVRTFNSIGGWQCEPHWQPRLDVWSTSIPHPAFPGGFTRLKRTWLSHCLPGMLWVGGFWSFFYPAGKLETSFSSNGA